VAQRKNCCTDDYGPFINISLLILRIVVVVLMLMHGVPKLGKVLAGDFNFPDPIGLGREISLLLATFAEFFCSLLILIGFRTRLAVIPLIITMLVALLIVHEDDAIFEHWNILLYLFAYGILLHLGGGKYSLTYYFQYRAFERAKETSP
jgi:putative oxidoreductase